MTKALKFKVGDKVSFVLVDKVLFTGIIVKAESTREFKPYTIKTFSTSFGSTTLFAHEEQLKLIK